MTMKLYYSPAYCSQAVHIALREAGIDATYARVDTVAGLVDDGRDWRAIQPRGYVPLLELDDGSRHSEVAALLQYVGDLEPASGLMPAVGTRERFEALQWLTFVSSELHKVFSPWLFHKETADSTRRAVKEKLAVRMADIEQRLQQRDWLVGDRFTVVDAYAFPILRWSPMVGISLKPYPRIEDYLRRIAARPAVQAALQAEGLPRG
jgi:glutathione S-transferase